MKGRKQIFGFLVYCLLFLGAILPRSTDARESGGLQIVPTPGSSCADLPQQEQNECRKRICPRICNKTGLTERCTADADYTYSYCHSGTCLRVPEGSSINPNDPRITAPGALPCNYTLDDLVGAGVNLARLIFGIAGSLILLFVFYGGFQLLSAVGNPEEIQKARKTLTAAFVGFIIIVSATILVSFAAKLIGGQFKEGEEGALGETIIPP